MLKASFLAYETIWCALFLFSISHALKNFGKNKTVAFFCPAILWGFLLEFATQEIFQRYYYGSGFLVYLLNVPVFISLAWGSQIYWGFFLAKEKLKLSGFFKISIAAALPLLLADALVFEPLAKTFGYWIWTPESVWFDSPIGNLYGWFWVIVLYLTAFQFVESKKTGFNGKFLLNILFIIPSLIALILLLKIWTFFFGKL